MKLAKVSNERDTMALISITRAKFSLRFPLSWYQLLRVSSNHVISKTFSLMPEVKTAEKLLHEHEMETTTSFGVFQLQCW